MGKLSRLAIVLVMIALASVPIRAAARVATAPVPGETAVATPSVAPTPIVAASPVNSPAPAATSVSSAPSNKAAVVIATPAVKPSASRTRSIDHYFYGRPASSAHAAAPIAAAAVSPTPAASVIPLAAAGTPASVPRPFAATAPPAAAAAIPVAAATATPSPTRVGGAAPVATLAAVPTPAVAMTAPLPATQSPAAGASPALAPASAMTPTVATAPKLSEVRAKPGSKVGSQANNSIGSHSPDHFFYGRPPGVPAPTAVAANPNALPATAGSATPAAAPTALAALVPPTTPPKSAPASLTASPSATPTRHSVDGLQLYLGDSIYARQNPFNWSITAIKSHHQMEVFYKGHLYQAFHAVFGRSRFAGPKQFEGDRRTPEGNYLIISKHRSARFRWFLKLNYPNAADQAEFHHMRADGDIPRGLGEGGSVGIHGTDLPILNVGNIDWTTGCISIDNEDISELARLLPIGTLVIIKP